MRLSGKHSPCYNPDIVSQLQVIPKFRGKSQRGSEAMLRRYRSSSSFFDSNRTSETCRLSGGGTFPIVSGTVIYPCCPWAGIVYGFLPPRVKGRGGAGGLSWLGSFATNACRLLWFFGQTALFCSQLTSFIFNATIAEKKSESVFSC